MNPIESRNKALVLEAFETLFNKRDYKAAEKFWSPDSVDSDHFYSISRRFWKKRGGPAGKPGGELNRRVGRLNPCA